MPVFNDSTNVLPTLPDGDYIYCVKDFNISLSSGGKTAGSDKYEVELEIEPTGNKVREFLIDHQSCSWKIDTFLKSAGVTLKKGEAFEFRQDIAQSKGVRWINPIGLRGWLALTTEPGQKDPTKKFNRVAVFYTDKQKLPTAVQPAPEAAADDVSSWQ